MKNRRNYYRLLHVQPDAPPEIIRNAYHTLMRELKEHPDLGGDQWHATIINEAYETLSNRNKRTEYDAKLRIGPLKKYFTRDVLKSKIIKQALKINFHRAYNRTTKKGTLLYTSPLFQMEKEATMLDLSPKGIGFLCSEALKPGSTIRLISPLFKASAKITNSRQIMMNGKIYYSVGAEFSSVVFEHPSGSFFSASV